MEEVIKYVINNQFIVVVVFLSICLVTYFLFSKSFKLALVIVLLLCGLCGYFYMQDPATAGKRLGNLWKGVKEKTVKVTESSSDAYSKGKEYIEKGKKAKEDEEKRIFSPSPAKEEKETP
ncbi:MAG: hypothetical protein LBV07_04400 [Syntrophobacterales bacterium]|jgi:ABC-type multidrug transport system fused ATPase/permease subunit|nr:hypothetical protein [Syntrophobacterales bacterium]